MGVDVGEEVEVVESPVQVEAVEIKVEEQVEVVGMGVKVEVKVEEEEEEEVVSRLLSLLFHPSISVACLYMAKQ